MNFSETVYEKLALVPLNIYDEIIRKCDPQEKEKLQPLINPILIYPYSWDLIEMKRVGMNWKKALKWKQINLKMIQI